MYAGPTEMYDHIEKSPTLFAGMDQASSSVLCALLFYFQSRGTQRNEESIAPVGSSDMFALLYLQGVERPVHNTSCWTFMQFTCSHLLVRMKS